MRVRLHRTSVVPPSSRRCALSCRPSRRARRKRFWRPISPQMERVPFFWMSLCSPLHDFFQQPTSEELRRTSVALWCTAGGPIPLVPDRLPADHVECDVHVIARGMRIGTILLVCLFNKSCQLGLLHALVLDVELDGQSEPTFLTRAD